MLNKLIDTLLLNFVPHGVMFLGAAMMSVAFFVFYVKNTQRNRFFMICRAFWMMSLASFGRWIAPALVFFNPAFAVSATAGEAFSFAFYAVAGGFLGASLFPQAPRTILRLVLMPFFTVLFLIGGAVLLHFQIPHLEADLIPLFELGVMIALAAAGFLKVPNLNNKTIYTTPRAGLFILSAYLIASAFQLVRPNPLIGFILYAGVAMAVLISQLKFMANSTQVIQKTLAEERANKTMFWDVAPFPILLTKLMDDSVVYMNNACQQVLGVDDAQKESVHFSDFFVNPEKREELIQRTKERSVADNFEVELNVQGQNHKTLWITLTSRVFEMDGEVVLYINFTNITAQKETEQQLFIQASTDTLTGLFNRRQFATLTNQAFALAQREQTPYCVLMMDIDHFKGINDTYGHDVGDIVLKHLSALARNTLRKSDILARWGGEEFIAFLPNTSPENAVVPAEKLRQAVEQTVVQAGNTQVRFTLSLGISLSQTPDINFIQKEADLALYYSKEHGRNRSTLYSPEMSDMNPEK